MKYKLSEDALTYYQKQLEKSQEPGKKAVEVLEAGINSVLAELGVNIDGDIQQQQLELGILITENTDERTPQLNGFFIYQVRDGDIVPIAWVGSARLEAGKAWIDIEWFTRNTRDAIGGIKLVGK